MKPEYQRSSERGNVLFYILIAVALIAALSYAVSAGLRGSGSQMTQERVDLFASEIIEYANVVSSAVAQLRLRGCTISQLSFENDVVAGYTNASAPSDESCHVFSINGGGVEWNVPPAEFLASATAPNDAWAIYTANEIQDVGITTLGDDEGLDLIIVLQNLDRAVCLELNERLGVSNPSGNPPADSGLDNVRYQGSFSYAATVGDEDVALKGKAAACYTDGGFSLGAGEHTFYKVLIAR